MWKHFRKQWSSLPFSVQVFLSLPMVVFCIMVVSVVHGLQEQKQKQQTEQALQVYCREACFPNDLDRVYGKQCYCKADVFIKPIITK